MMILMIADLTQVLLLLLKEKKIMKIRMLHQNLKRDTQNIHFIN